MRAVRPEVVRGKGVVRGDEGWKGAVRSQQVKTKDRFKLRNIYPAGTGIQL